MVAVVTGECFGAVKTGWEVAASGQWTPRQAGTPEGGFCSQRTFGAKLSGWRCPCGPLVVCEEMPPGGRISQQKWVGLSLGIKLPVPLAKVSQIKVTLDC